LFVADRYGTEVATDQIGSELYFDGAQFYCHRASFLKIFIRMVPRSIAIEQVGS
jgi:hypothetical protein